MLQEPLGNDAARTLIGQIVRTGRVRFGKHALDAMADDALTTLDALNVLRGGVVEFSEYERGSWRYRVRTSRMTFVVAFRSETLAVVVTAWRKK